MFRQLVNGKSLQLASLVLLLVMLSSSVTVLAVTSNEPLTPAAPEPGNNVEYNGLLKETITEFTREYVESFSKPALEKLGPLLSEYYTSRIISENIVRKGDQVHIRAVTGPVPVTTLGELMAITSTFDIGFSKIVFGFVDSPEAVLTVAEVPGVIEVEATYKAGSLDSLNDFTNDESYSIGELPPEVINQFLDKEIYKTGRVHDELGIDGSGVTISIHDTGVDFSNLNLGYDALARTISGKPAVFDAVGDGIVLTPYVVTKDGSGYLNVSDISPTENDTLPIWTYNVQSGQSQQLDFFTFPSAPVLQDMKAPVISSMSGKYKFGMISQTIFKRGIPFVFLNVPVVLIDSVTAGVYDAVVADFETGVNITATITGLNYTKFPGVNYNEWDFSNNLVHRWGDGTEIMGKDFDGDGLNDIGAGTLCFAMDLYGALNHMPRMIEGINATGSGFALMFDTYGHATWCASLAASRGTVGYPVFDEEFTGASYWENTTTYTLPGAAIGAKIQGVKAGPVGSIEPAGYAGFFWSCGFDYNPTTHVWEFTGDHYANISSHSYGGDRLYSFTENNWMQMVRDVLSVPGYFSPSYNGQLFVHSAGNEGSGMQSISSGGGAELTVGSSAKYTYFSQSYGEPQGFDQSAAYASKGPGNLGYPKPDILSPGYIEASCAPPWQFHNNNHFASGNGTFDWWSGTSASCPFAAGVAALVYQAYYQATSIPITPGQAKTIIKSTAKDLHLNPFIQGSGQLEAYRAVQLALLQSEADGIPLIYAGTLTSFHELALIVNCSLAGVWGPTGTYASYTSDYPSSANMTSFTQHPGLSIPVLDGSLYLGQISQGASKNGTISTACGVGGVDNVVAKQFKETTTAEFTVTTNDSFYYPGIGYYYPFLLDNYFTTAESTAFRAAEFAWIHVSMELEDRATDPGAAIGFACLMDWHDDGDGIPEYANLTTTQVGEFTELTRNAATDVNSWNLQLGHPGTAFPTDNPMILIRSYDTTINATQFTGAVLTIRIRMFTLGDWTDITVTSISGLNQVWNVTANVAADEAPGIQEGILLITKGSGTVRMPLSYMVTAELPLGPDELVIGGETSNTSYDSFAYYVPWDGIENDYQTSDLRTYSFSLDDPSATYIAVNATWLHEDSLFNMWLYGPDLIRVGTTTIDFPEATGPTKNYYFFDLALVSQKTGVYTLFVESAFINLPPEILTLNLRYLTIADMPTLTATWSAANNTVLTGPNAQLTTTWSSFSGAGQLPDLEVMGTRLSFVRGEEVNETAMFGGTYGFSAKTFTRNFLAGDTVTIHVGVAPVGPDLDTTITNPSGRSVGTMSQPWYTNPETLVFTADDTGTYEIEVVWWGGSWGEGLPADTSLLWEMYCYTNNFVFSSAESTTNSVTIDTGTLGLDDGNYRVVAHALTGTSYGFSETRYYTLDNFLPPTVTVVAPNGGETVSGTVLVNFTIADPNAALGTETVDWIVYYSGDGGSQWTKITQGTGTGSKSIEWSTTNIKQGSNFKIKVVATDSTGLTAEDMSDSTFTLGAATPSATPGFTWFALLILPVLAVIPIFWRRRRS